MNGYILAPLDLTERQMLIYMCLYRKCNFENMQVAYTTNQIVTDIKIIDLTDRIVNAELKKMIEAGYLNVVTKGSKGNPTTYQIVKYSDLVGNLNVTYPYVKSNLKDSDCNTSNDKEVTYPYVKSNLNVIPIKEKEKEKEKDIKKEKVTNFDKMISAYTQNNNLVEAIKDFIKMRKTIKKPLTDRALKGILNKLDSFSNSDIEKIEILENSIMNCWQGIFELKNKKAPVGAGTNENKKTNYNPSICKKEMKNTPAVKEFKFI